MHRIARNRALNPPAFRFHFALHESEVRLSYLAAGELFGEPAMRRVVLGHQQDAAGEAIQAMYNSRPHGAAHRRELSEAVQ